MSFYIYDENGEPIIRKRVTLDCQKAIENGEKVLVEQSHKDNQDINNIVKRHAGNMEMIAKTNLMQSPEYQFDDIPGNDFFEAMQIVTKAQQTFETLPSDVRHEFHNNPAEYVDYCQDPDNAQALVERGWAHPPEPEPQPIEVVVTNPETPTETPTP